MRWTTSVLMLWGVGRSACDAGGAPSVSDANTLRGAVADGCAPARNCGDAAGTTCGSAPRVALADGFVTGLRTPPDVVAAAVGGRRKKLTEPCLHGMSGGKTAIGCRGSSVTTVWWGRT